MLFPAGEGRRSRVPCDERPKEGVRRGADGGAMRVLLSGATGCVGRAFLLHAKNESDVRVVATARGRSGRRPEGASEWLACSLADLPDRLDEVGRVDACVHAAAVVHRPGAPLSEVRSVNVDQTVALARRLKETSPGARFVFVSSIAASEPERSAYASCKAEAEEALARLRTKGRLDVVILRVATVYGRGDRGNIGSLARAMARGLYVRTAPAGVRKTLVWSRAVAATLLAAADGRRGCPHFGIVADPTPYTLGEIEDALARALGTRSPRRLPFPFPTLFGAAGTVAERLTGRHPPFTLSTLNTLRREVVERVTDGALASEVKKALRGTDLAARFRSAYGDIGRQRPE